MKQNKKTQELPVFTRPKQPLDVNILVVTLIAISIAIFVGIANYFYEGWEILVLAGMIKAAPFSVVLFFALRQWTIYDVKYIILLGFLHALIISAMPYILTYLFIVATYGFSEISPIEFFKEAYTSTGISTEYNSSTTIGEASTSDLIGYYLYAGLDFLALCLAPLAAYALFAKNRIWSDQQEDFFVQTINTTLSFPTSKFGVIVPAKNMTFQMLKEDIAKSKAFLTEAEAQSRKYATAFIILHALNGDPRKLFSYGPVTFSLTAQQYDEIYEILYEKIYGESVSKTKPQNHGQDKS